VRALGGPDALDDRTGFHDLGLDSLMAVQLRRRLASVLGTALPTTLTFNYPSVAALSAYLFETLQGGDGAATAATAPASAAHSAPPAHAEVAADAVADDDVHALLMAELARLPADMRADDSGSGAGA
jgi:acyl carrier protein